MKHKIIVCSIFLTCLFTNGVFGQNAIQIKEKYGQPIEAYSVSEHIWMTPEFTDDGQICKMRLYPKRISETTNYLSDKLNHWELKNVLNQLVPPETRGEKSDFFGLTFFIGQMSNTVYGYQKVSINFLASLNLRGVEIKKSETIKTQKVTDADESEAELRIPQDAKIVTIIWQEKTCAKR